MDPIVLGSQWALVHVAISTGYSNEHILITA